MKRARAGHPPAIRIDVANETAWCGDKPLLLTPKAFAVLRHLVEHAGRLITKDDLLTTVWRDAIVSDAALASCIRDLRRVLAESSSTPRYIETVHRRGFRFIGPVAPSAAAGLPRSTPVSRIDVAVEPPPGAPPALRTVVGREAELAHLHAALARAMNGQRQLIFVTGEPGIGKTALVDEFVSQIAAERRVRVGHGQCVEQYGAGEAYLPVLEALGRLGRDADGAQVVQTLKQHAPTWLMQLPALLADADLDAVQRRAQGATRDRMLRELVDALDALSMAEPLILILEDLHWSDSSTIDLLARLARRRDPARLLVLGTYRPADVAATAHPLRSVKQELRVHAYCDEIPLEFLSVAAVGQYLARRFGAHRFPAELALVLHRNTGGNALFVVNTVDELMAQGHLHDVDGTWQLAVPVKEVGAAAPQTLSQIVDKQFERLTPDEQAVLTVATVAGVEFSAAVATAEGIDAREAERRCEALARRGQFLRAAGVAEWPDGTVAGRYAFIHAVYQHALYARLPIMRRVGLHLRTGERLERAYGSRAGELAGELAVHFEHGRDLERAVQYRHQATDHALRQHGYREAAAHAIRALEVLSELPGSPERIEQELSLRVMLGTALTATKGYSAPEVERTYARALELCGEVEETPRLFPVLLGLGWFYTVRGPARAAAEVGQRLLTMGQAAGDRAILLAAHNALGVASFYAGEFEPALAHLERGIELYDPGEHSPNRSPAFRAGLDPGLSCAAHAAWALWALGYPERAAARMQEALALARSIAHPFTLAHACRFAAAFHLSRREADAVREQEEATFALSTEHGLNLFLLVGTFHRGWLLAEGGQPEQGLAQMRDWVTSCRQTRSECLIPTYLAWSAELHGRVGRTKEGLALVEEAIATSSQSGYRYWMAELHRLQGTLGGASGNAAACFREAIEIARRQRAKLFELRAATSLSRLWAEEGKLREAQALLSATYGWFTEGFDSPDLSEAKLLLAELDRRAGGRGPAGRAQSHAKLPRA